MDLVGFVREAGLLDCGILSCRLDASVCTGPADRMTGVDCVFSADVIVRTDCVEILAEVNGEEVPEARECLDGRPEPLSLRGRLLSDETKVDTAANGTSEASWTR